MVGGTAEDVERCRPMFQATGKLVVHTGDLGSAHYLAVADKDRAIALEPARDLGIELPVTSLCAEGIAEVYGQTTQRRR